MSEFDFWLDCVDNNRPRINAAFKAAFNTALNHKMIHVKPSEGESFDIVDMLYLNGEPRSNGIDEMKNLLDSVVSTAITAYEGIKNKSGTSTASLSAFGIKRIDANELIENHIYFTETEALDMLGQFDQGVLGRCEVVPVKIKLEDVVRRSAPG